MRLKKKAKTKKILSFMAMLICMVMLLGEMVQVKAASAAVSTIDNPVVYSMTSSSTGDSLVGRYKFKYIGNSNYYQFFENDNEKTDKSLYINSASSKARKAAKSVLGKDIANSSSATLKKADGGNGKIKAAYLVWQTRSEEGPGSKIALVDPNGKATVVLAEKAVVDKRKCTVGTSWEQTSLYCMYADVTKFITGSNNGGKAKFGTYSVCNIPVWQRNDLTKGESPATWELIVLEEGDNFPIRSCKLEMTSTFNLNTELNPKNLKIDLDFGRKLKTRANDGGKVKGQVFFGCSTSHNLEFSEKKLTLKKDNGKSAGTKDLTESSMKKIGNSSVKMELLSFNETNFYDAASATYSIKTSAWTSFFLLGIAVDVAQPEFEGGQTTTINSDGTVNVSATDGNIIKNVTNTSKQGATGYYDGKFYVTLDNALEPIDTGNITLSYYNKEKNKTYTVAGGYNNHVITFTMPTDGKNYYNYTNGSYLSYDIQCKVVDQNTAEYTNSHQLDGYLYSRGAETGVWVEDLQSSSSSAKLEGYTVHYDGNGGDTSNIPDMTCRRDVSYNITEELPTREGYTFLGWGNNPGDNTPSYYPSSFGRGNSAFYNLANVGETKTLYAIWAAGDDYTVHYNPNGGTGNVYDMQCAWNEIYKHPSPGTCGFSAPVVNGETLRFVGWATEAKGQPIYYQGSNFINLADRSTREITLYAIWTPNHYEVVYTNRGDFSEEFTSYENAAKNRKTQECEYDIEYTTLGKSDFVTSSINQRFEAWYKLGSLNAAKSYLEKLERYEQEISAYEEEIAELEENIRTGAAMEEEAEKRIEQLQELIEKAKEKRQEVIKSIAEFCNNTKVISEKTKFKNLPEKAGSVTSYEYKDGSNYPVAIVRLYSFYGADKGEYISVNYYGNGADSGSKDSQVIFLGEEKQSVTIGNNIPPNDGFKLKNSQFLAWSTDKDISWKKLCDKNGDYNEDYFNSDTKKKVYAQGAEITLSIKNGKLYLEKGLDKMQLTGDLDLYAVWKPTAFEVTLHAGTGIAADSLQGAGTYEVGDMVEISAVTKTGYHWLNWTGNPGEDESQIKTITEQTYSFRMPEHAVDLTANGEANQYTIRFDPNGGTGHIDDIVTTYDTDVTLPDAVDNYKKYTLDGRNVTADVVSGVIPEDLIIRSGYSGEEAELQGAVSEAEYSNDDADMEGNKKVSNMDEISEASETSEVDGEADIAGEVETDGEAGTADETENANEWDTDGETENADETEENGESAADSEMESDGETDGELEAEEEIKAAHSVKRAYPSVFLGWALYDDKDKLTPTWKASDVVKNLTEENNGVVTLYAVWDDCPWITATDQYYTLKQAQDGFITIDEILSHTSAVDREDGSPILPGTNPAVNNPTVSTLYTIPDYQPTEFTSMTHDAAISENLTVTDSVGNTYIKQIMVYIIDTTPQKVKPIGTTRFISEKYFNADYEHGGLEDNSIWKTDPEYRAALQEAFDNSKNGTPEATYYFTHETILEMAQFVEEHGPGNLREPGALQLFYDTFMAPNRIN